MTITVDRKEFSRALAAAKRTLGKGKTFPVLGCVRLDVTAEGELEVQSTDMESSTRVRVKGYCDTASGEVEAVCVPHKRLAAVVRGMKGEELTLTWRAGHGFKVTCGVAAVDIDTEDEDAYPELYWSSFSPDVTVGRDHFTFTTDRLAAMLRETTYAASRDVTRFNLGGVFIDDRNGRLSFVATDGHRLAVSEDTLYGGEGWRGIGQIASLGGILALEALVTAKRPIGATVHAVATGKRICFSIGSVDVLASVIDGTYPNYRQSIPESGKAACVARVSLDALADAVSTVDTGDKEAPFVLLSFDMDSIVVSSKAGKCIVPTLGNTPDSGPISFNGRYLHQLCASFAGSQH